MMTMLCSRRFALAVRSSLRLINGYTVHVYKQPCLAPHHPPSAIMHSTSACADKKLPLKMYNLMTAFEKDSPGLKECRVSGTIPVWVKGDLYRNGAGKYKFGSDISNHFLDGLAIIHHFQIEDGKVSYQNRLLQSDNLKLNESAQRRIAGEFGSAELPDPCKSIFTRYFSHFLTDRPNDNCSVNIMKLGDQFYALTETNIIHQIDPKTLDSCKQVDLKKIISVHLSTAHPLVDLDGTTYNMGSQFGKESSYCVVKYPPTEAGCSEPLKKAQMICNVKAEDSAQPSYFHSFGMTQNHLVLMEQPFKFDSLKILTRKFTGISISDALCYHPDKKTRFHLIKKSTGEHLDQVFTADPSVTFHHINSYEEDGHLVLDIIDYANADFIEDTTMEGIRQGKLSDNTLSRISRFVFPLDTNDKASVGENLITLKGTTATAVKQEDGGIHCTPQMHKKCHIDLARWNEKLNGLKYKYAYGMYQPNGIFKGDMKLAKVDVDTGEMILWGEDDYVTSEPIFLPAPDAVDEDDGVILSPLVSTDESKPCVLVVLDAKTFTELGRAHLPSWTPFSFHGIFDPKI